MVSSFASPWLLRSFAIGSWTDIAGCSIALTSGTYLGLATIQARNNGSTGTCGVKMYYGTTDLVSAEAAISSSFANLVFSLHCVFVVSGAQTLKIAGREDAGTMVAKRYGDYDMGAANIPGTYLSVVKIA